MNPFAMLARYNAWANARAYDAADALPEADYRADCGAAFGSVHGTFNHLVVGDLIWMSRITGEGEAPTRLDAIVADDRRELRRTREALDARIRTFAEGLSDAAIAGTFSYTPITRPEPVTQPLGPVLLHVFNHQTHHRGQVHAMLTRLAGEAPALDLIYYQRETGDGVG
ncbi:DinB family protein [Acuticoccus sp.]|uniref:DinB family protein n=1 Tax=Acuticoccus sp. TaxID=1904378 RepID=UPI003B521DAD